MDIITLLLNKGAVSDINERYCSLDEVKGSYAKGLTPLGYAVDGGHLDAVKLLIEHGAKVTDKRSDNDHRNYLQVAAKQGNMDIAEYLIEKGLNVSDACDDGQKMTALHMSIQAGHADMAAMLIAKGAALEAVDSENQTPLHLAVRQG